MPQGFSLGVGDSGLACGQSVRKNFTKLPELRKSASLSAQCALSKCSYKHLYSGKNSLRAVRALSEFFRKMLIFNEC